MAKQKVYFTKDKGPGLWQALGELKNNPIAHYGLLQARRRMVRSPRWQKLLLGFICIAMSVAISPVLFRAIISLWEQVWFGNLQIPQTPELILTTMIALTLIYACWLMLGLFQATRDAVLILTNPRVGAPASVDELVAISSLSDTEVLLGSMMLIVQPLIPRLIVGAAIPLGWISGILFIGQQVPPCINQYFSTYRQYTATTSLLSPNMYSSQSILEAGGAGVLIFLAMVLHGLAALVILYLLLTTAGRKTSHSLFASIAAMFHSVVQTAWFCLLGVSFISIPIEKVLNMSMDIDLSGMEFLMLIGLGSGPIAILLLLRLMRSSMIIRCGALAIPAPLPLLMLAYAVNRTLTDSSWLSLLAFPLALILPGFACLAYATGVVDQSASPLVVALPDIQGAGMLEYSFSYLWFVKLACQSILLPVLFIMARDAIRLYRQPGQL